MMMAAAHGEAELVQKLIEAAGDDCDINKKTFEGWTALHFATVLAETR